MKLFNILDTTFDNFDNTVRNYLSKTFNDLGLNYTPNQIFGVIYEGIKGVMQNALFYIEDALTEQNIYTATRKRSFYSLAKLSGYEPYYGSAATGTLTLQTLPSNIPSTEQTTKLFIRNHAAVINRSTGTTYTIFLPTDEYVIDTSKPLVQHRVKIAQGVWTSARFVANGENYEAFQVTQSSLYDKQYITVKVNGEEYHQVPCIYDMFEDEKGYIMTSGFDGVFEISFGNGAHGHVLSQSDIVDIEFLTHDGTTGNIISPGTEQFSMIAPCYASSGATLKPEDYFTMTLDEPVTGGTDADTIDMVKSMIGFNSRSLVLASEDNYKQFLRRFSFIGRATIFTDASSMTVTAACLSNVLDKIRDAEDYLDLDVSQLCLTEKQKDMVKTTIKNSGKAFAGIKFTFADPVVRRYAGICYVKLKEDSQRAAATANIRNAIAKYFMSLPESTTFIPKSDLIRVALDSDDNIKSFDIDIISEAAEEAWHDGYWIKYVQRLINGVYQFVPVKTLYEEGVTPCMDVYGNILVDSTSELPILSGGFKYYDKTTGDSIVLPTLDVLFH